MLAQNFKTAAELKITDVEFDALCKVLGMLERGELHHAPKIFGHVPKQGFNMKCSGRQTDCGTVACIGGWAAVLMGNRDMSINDYVNHNRSAALIPLYWSNTSASIKPAQAAIALRNYLTYGDPRWEEALAIR